MDTERELDFADYDEAEKQLKDAIKTNEEQQIKGEFICRKCGLRKKYHLDTDADPF